MSRNRVVILLFASIALFSAGSAAQGTVAGTDFARAAVEKVYQPGFARFARASEAFLAAAENACDNPSREALLDLRAHFEGTVEVFSAVELFRTGPLLDDNRQNRLFYWPDKRRVGERQMRDLLADSEASLLTVSVVAGKSVAVQGLPALERLLYGRNAEDHPGIVSDAPECQVVTAIVGNIQNMAAAINDAWQIDSELVRSLLNPEQGSAYFRTTDEVLRSLVTQIIVGIDVVLDRKIAALTDDNGPGRQAPLWRSRQTLSMIRANLDAVRALSVDTGLASVGELHNELAFEFRSADQMLQKLQSLTVLIDDQGRLSDEAESLLRALTAVVGGIKNTLSDRFTAALGITAGFNSEDGD